MRVLFLGNKDIARGLYYFLVDRGLSVFPWTLMGTPPPGTGWVIPHRFDICMSILFPHILTREFIECFPLGVVNLHPSLLPYCRGRFPALWAMADGKPAGVTLHYIDEGVDTGEIIAQRHVGYRDETVCMELYGRCLEAGVELFHMTWPKIEAGVNNVTPQPDHKATFHLAGEVRDWRRDTLLTAAELRREYGTG